VTIPDHILRAARARAEARRTKDWPAADRLRLEIEAAGWRIVDHGADFRLEPAHPPDVETGGLRRYGQSDSAPSRLGDPATGVATIVMAVPAVDGEAGLAAVTASLAGALGHAPPGVDAVVVADGLDDTEIAELTTLAPRFEADGRDVEIVATSAPLGQAAALNIGLRRSTGSVIVVIDASVEPAGDVIGPLTAALAEPAVAVAGPFGLASADLRHFEEVEAAAQPVDVAAVQGYLLAVRRADAIARGPLDERFRYYRNLDIWWSLVLRDEGEGRPPRRALAVPGLPLRRGVPAAWSGVPAAERDRLSKRNFYRVLDRFRSRADLAVGPPSG